ncbi:hypothetical protein Tco_0840657 [Tanacetum coccineum]|uniref:Uncharacterized protein n=1 Tax=Tanacetum coccineum TaxID=301880 RepID=A0ABQ5AUM1_9ASTR
MSGQRCSLRNMQNQGSKPAFPNGKFEDMLLKFVLTTTASTSRSGTLPGNTVPTKGRFKVSPPEVVLKSKDRKAVSHDTESNVISVDTPIPKASIPFPSRRNDENRREKARTN